jgi:hypothetical protein
MKIAFALYVALTWVLDVPVVQGDKIIQLPDNSRQILDLHKTYETEEACLAACKALELEGAAPSSLKALGGDGKRHNKAVMDYFCIEVPGE